MNYHLRRLYEEVGTPEESTAYYEQALKGEPNYFMIHRALGFIYLSRRKAAVEKIKASVEHKDMEANKKANAEYKAIVLKAIPY